MTIQQTEVATFAGGCFWCMVKPFTSIDGIKSVVSGYTGGRTVNPTYRQVCSGATGHTEAVQIIFDPALISYKDLLDIYWRQIDPTDATGQFFDRGVSYRPAIFYHSEEQKYQAEQSRISLESSAIFDKPITVAIEPAQTFYPAEEYHQDFYKKDPKHYNRYQIGSGRQRFLEQYWSDNSDEQQDK
jgi:peptide-methionine (S)-S-oxide reductase